MNLVGRAIRAIMWVGVGWLLATGGATQVIICLGIGFVVGLINVRERNILARRVADARVQATGGNGRVGPRRPATFRVSTRDGARIVDGEVR